MQYDEQELSRAKPDHAHRFLRAHHGQRLFCQTGYGTHICYFDMFFRKRARQRRLRHHGRRGAAGGVPAEPALHRGGHRLICAAKSCLQRGVPGVSAALSALPATSGRCPEGTPIFPGEPIVTVRGPAIQAQFIETMVLLCVNHQSLIATKANRIVRAAQGRPVMEFGSRRAQGFDGAMLGRPGRLHRRVRRHRLHHQPTEMYGVPAVRHHGPQLGADVPRRSTSAFKAYCRGCTPTTARCWWTPTTC